MADIKVNAQEWEKLSENERSQITSIMKEQHLLTAADRIVGDATAPPSMQTAKAAATQLASVAKTHREMTAAAAAHAGAELCRSKTK